jgi:hypothetical protein
MARALEQRLAVFLFFDESGNLHFAPGGSKYYFFGALTTRTPVALSHSLSELRYELLAQGVELERFHAAEDRQAVRDRVFDIIRAESGIEFDVVVIEKAKANPVLHDPARFYPQFASYLLRYVFARYTDTTERMVIVTDRLPVEKRRRAVEKAFKTFISANVGSRSYTLLHQASAVHACLQAADYLTWAVHKKWTHGERRPYDQIRGCIRSEFDIFAGGTHYYY